MYDALLNTHKPDVGCTHLNSGLLWRRTQNNGTLSLGYRCPCLKTVSKPCVVTISGKEGFYAGNEEGIKVRGDCRAPDTRKELLCFPEEGTEQYEEVTAVQGLGHKPICATYIP